MNESTSLLQNAQPQRWVYYGFIFLGLGSLLPWNFFITADAYWQYKFRNTSTEFDPNGEKTPLQNLYTPMQVILSCVINFLFLLLNALSSGISSNVKKITYSLVIMMSIFIVTAAMAKVNSDNWQLTFFILTMVIIVLITASGGIFQGGLVGTAGMFPEKYMCGVSMGQSLGGIFASLARIVSLAVGADEVSSAFIYFLIAVVVMLMTLVVFRFVSNTDYYKEQTDCTPPDEFLDSKSVNVVLHSHWDIFKQLWPMAISVACIFMVTLCVYPVMCVRVLPVSNNEIWAKTYFEPVITFLLFNICDFFGRNSSGWILWPKRNSNLIHLFTWMRLIFIPLLMCCNHDVNSDVPIWFYSDVVYIGLLAMFGYTNGYLSTIIMMYAPKMVSTENAEKASGMMAAMIGLGLLLGSCLSFVFALVP